jgi:hypothetical protein
MAVSVQLALPFRKSKMLLYEKGKERTKEEKEIICEVPRVSELDFRLSLLFYIFGAKSTLSIDVLVYMIYD